MSQNALIAVCESEIIGQCIDKVLQFNNNFIFME